MKKQEQQPDDPMFYEKLPNRVDHDDSFSPVFRSGLRKSQIAGMAGNSVGHLLEEGNVFEVAEALAAMEEFAKCVRKDDRYIQYLRDELAKHNGRFITCAGARLEICEAGVSYDYASNNEWKELDGEIRNLTERKKALEEKLRKIAPGKIIVDEETGEVTEGINKRSTSTYRITLAK